MIQISLIDSRFKQIPRAQPTVAVKRKGSNQYKGRLCVRWGAVPLNKTARITPPNCSSIRNQSGVCFGGENELGDSRHRYSHSFSQSSKLYPEDRVAVLPPQMIQKPWNGKLPPIQTDVSQLPKPAYGFLLIRSLYGGRDAPMRRFVAMSERMRSHGFNQLENDVCMFNNLDSCGNLAGFF